MKKTLVFSLFGLVLLAGCAPRQGVEVVKAPATKTEFRPQSSSDQIPEGVSAVCSDGSYSKSPVEQACQGHGGVVKVIAHYHSD